MGGGERQLRGLTRRGAMRAGRVTRSRVPSPLEGEDQPVPAGADVGRHAGRPGRAGTREASRRDQRGHRRGGRRGAAQPHHGASRAVRSPPAPARPARRRAAGSASAARRGRLGMSPPPAPGRAPPGTLRIRVSMSSTSARSIADPPTTATPSFSMRLPPAPPAIARHSAGCPMPIDGPTARPRRARAPAASRTDQRASEVASAAPRSAAIRRGRPADTPRRPVPCPRSDAG